MDFKCLEYAATKTGSVAQNLRECGLSHRICTMLRKEMGLVTVNGEVQTLAFICQKSDLILVKIPQIAPKIVPKLDVDIEVVYEDESLAIINKPHGIATLATRAHYGKSLQNALAAMWGDFVYRPVNRLDAETSGLMLVAKDNFTHSVLSQDIKAVKRGYLALVCGQVSKGGTINAPIARESDSIIKRCVSSEGADAITHFNVVAQYRGYTLLSVQLDTGKTHQIRVHMSYIGFPLAGDGLYGGSEEIIKRQALHSNKITFIHPTTKQLITYEVPLPDDIAAAIKIVEKG